MYIVVGLGNPGKKYENNRHNVGFMTVDRLAEKLGISITKSKFKSVYGEANYKGKKLILVKPQTFMNVSGESVQPFVKFFNVDLENLIVITDDIDIEFGTVRIRKKGSAGTHNGLKSIVNLLGNSSFPRIKVAVGRKPSYMDLADYVLSNFTKDEKEILEKEIDLAVEAVLHIVESGLDEAMNKVNPIKYSL